jgi:hypothetical protein
MLKLAEFHGKTSPRFHQNLEICQGVEGLQGEVKMMSWTLANISKVSWPKWGTSDSSGGCQRLGISGGLHVFHMG